MGIKGATLGFREFRIKGTPIYNCNIPRSLATLRNPHERNSESSRRLRGRADEMLELSEIEVLRLSDVGMRFIRFRVKSRGFGARGLKVFEHKLYNALPSAAQGIWHRETEAWIGTLNSPNRTQKENEFRV